MFSVWKRMLSTLLFSTLSILYNCFLPNTLKFKFPPDFTKCSRIFSWEESIFLPQTLDLRKIIILCRGVWAEIPQFIGLLCFHQHMTLHQCYFLHSVTVGKSSVFLDSFSMFLLNWETVNWSTIAVKVIVRNSAGPNCDNDFPISFLTILNYYWLFCQQSHSHSSILKSYNTSF